MTKKPLTDYANVRGSVTLGFWGSKTINKVEITAQGPKKIGGALI